MGLKIFNSYNSTQPNLIFYFILFFLWMISNLCKIYAMQWIFFLLGLPNLSFFFFSEWSQTYVKQIYNAMTFFMLGLKNYFADKPLAQWLSCTCKRISVPRVVSSTPRVEPLPSPLKNDQKQKKKELLLLDLKNCFI